MTFQGSGGGKTTPATQEFPETILSPIWRDDYSTCNGWKMDSANCRDASLTWEFPKMFTLKIPRRHGLMGAFASDSAVNATQRPRLATTPALHTPSDIIDRVHAVLGDIDLDPASNPVANEEVKAKQIYTKDDDGLVQDWHGKVFLNPPFGSDKISQFVKKLVSEYQSGNVSEAILLTESLSQPKWFSHAIQTCDAVFMAADLWGGWYWSYMIDTIHKERLALYFGATENMVSRERQHYTYSSNPGVNNLFTDKKQAILNNLFAFVKPITFRVWGHDTIEEAYRNERKLLEKWIQRDDVLVLNTNTPSGVPPMRNT